MLSLPDVNNGVSRNFMNALIGYTGFVGSTLLAQGLNRRGDWDLYNSKNISGIRGRSYEKVICAGAPAQKWLANKDPDADQKNIESLMYWLGQMDCKEFILISTIDVFKDPVDVDETSDISIEGLHPYGKNRRDLEVFVQQRYPEHLIIRLPGLVGDGLRKNAIYDIKHDNDVDKIDSRGVFQFYPMYNLSEDIFSRFNSQGVIHLVSEPVSVEQVAKEAFDLVFINHILDRPPTYSMKTIETPSGYQYSKSDVISFIRRYAKNNA